MNFEEIFRESLASHYTNQEISYFLRCISEDISDSDNFVQKDWQKIIDRLISQEPIQYITGLAPFYGYFFYVGPSVLIPRPETEELVYLVSNNINKSKLKSLKILEIGSGSGCIPITLSLLHPDAQITSVDVSEGALTIAERNNKKLNAKVDFLNINFLEEEMWDQISDAYDVIVSNPPYIPVEEKKLMSPNVLEHEPHLALFVEDYDPLIFYRKIHEFSLENLNTGGIVFLECNEYNAQKVQKLYSDRFDAEVIKDLQGKDRMLIAKLT